MFKYRVYDILPSRSMNKGEQSMNPTLSGLQPILRALPYLILNFPYNIPNESGLWWNTPVTDTSLLLRELNKHNTGPHVINK